MSLQDYFNAEAPGYDDRFSTHPVGRRYRQTVWDRVHALAQGERLLDVGCGTGIDAAHFASMGLAVTALEPSTGMLAVAQARPEANTVRFEHTDLLGWDALGERWPLVLSNFGALNCVPHDQSLADKLADLVEPGGHLIAVVMGPTCLWEMIYFALHGDARAWRRWTRAVPPLNLHYPSARQLSTLLAPAFEPVAPLTGLGIFEPPSYAFHLHERWPLLFRGFAAMESAVQHMWPFNRVADHYVLVARRRGSGSAP